MITGIPYDKINSGVHQLLAQMDVAYAVHDQDATTMSLDVFFDQHCGNLPLQLFLTQFDLKYQDANQRAGLAINDVGLSHLMLSASGISEKTIDDVKLQMQGDMSRFNEIKAIVSRLTKNQQAANTDPKQVFYM